eukprot:scaffold736_cov144-Isochrysis_galbana.AAC.1
MVGHNARATRSHSYAYCYYRWATSGPSTANPHSYAYSCYRLGYIRPLNGKSTLTSNGSACERKAHGAVAGGEDRRP